MKFTAQQLEELKIIKYCAEDLISMTDTPEGKLWEKYHFLLRCKKCDTTLLPRFLVSKLNIDDVLRNIDMEYDFFCCECYNIMRSEIENS